MKRQRWKGFIIYLIIGLVSLSTIYPVQRAAIEGQIEQLNLEVSIPVEIMTLISLINPLSLLLFGLLAGMFLAEKVGLSSAVFRERTGTAFFVTLIRGWKPALFSGFALGVFFVTFDLLMRPYLPEVFQGPIERPNPLNLLSALLYGGMVEEMMLRWGLMTVFVFLAWKIVYRKASTPPQAAYIMAILASALLFALGHYGATAAVTDMTPIIWVRMIALNGAGGIVFGWFYWKYQLETAMIAHMSTHVAMAIVTFALSFFW